jgi:hypothetical protein
MEHLGFRMESMKVFFVLLALLVAFVVSSPVVLTKNRKDERVDLTKVCTLPTEIEHSGSTKLYLKIPP